MLENLISPKRDENSFKILKTQQKQKILLYLCTLVLACNKRDPGRVDCEALKVRVYFMGCAMAINQLEAEREREMRHMQHKLLHTTCIMHAASLSLDESRAGIVGLACLGASAALQKNICALRCMWRELW